MANVPKGIPTDSAVVIPRLICPDVAAAIDFCTHTFGAVSRGDRPGPDGKVAHALLALGSGMIMIEREWPGLPSRVPGLDGSSPGVIYVYVEDVDQTVERSCGTWPTWASAAKKSTLTGEHLAAFVSQSRAKAVTA